MKKKGFTLIELLVVIAIIAMLLAILMPALNKVKKIAQRVVCGTNLKGLGTAQAVYANDYEDQFAKQGGNCTLTWTVYENCTSSWQVPGATWNDGSDKNITVGASLYLLVREADVSPKSFVCGGGGQTAYDGRNTNNTHNPDLVELWDFGSEHPNHTAELGPSGPRYHVSYSYQFPYCSFAATGAASASFAVMADKNPWFDTPIPNNSTGKLEERTGAPPSSAATAGEMPGLVMRMAPYFSSSCEKWEKQIANTYAHGREGQNVTFGDGHSSYEKETDVGVRHDNIYTKQGDDASNEAAVRIGRGSEGMYAVPDALINTSADYAPRRNQDSLLVNDDY
jgi:prepilin-type N-terminal cleavage/methylation domain-containing protein